MNIYELQYITREDRYEPLGRFSSIDNAIDFIKSSETPLDFVDITDDDNYHFEIYEIELDNVKKSQKLAADIRFSKNEDETYTRIIMNLNKSFIPQTSRININNI